MPIGSGIVYNTGDLILSQVSSSGTAFLETKIAAATSSIIYFDNTARINSASLNSLTVGTASYFSGSTAIIGNLTSSNISASSITASLLGTSSWATNALTASFVSNAFIQGGNSFGTTALLGTNDANSLAFETNATTRMTINSGGHVGIGISPVSYYKTYISDTHVASQGSASLYVVTNQNQGSGATSANDVGIYSVYNVTALTSSTLQQNQAAYNTIFLNASGSYSGSYRAIRNGIFLSNTASFDTNANLINTYLTNQIGSSIPSFSINNFYAGDLISTSEITPGSTTGTINNLYGYSINTPWSNGTAITTSNSYGAYIYAQKSGTNGVVNGWGIYQAGTSDRNIFAGITRIGGTTSPVNTLDVSGNISASVITASLFFGTSSWAQTANALNPNNNYTVAGITADYVDVVGSGTIPTTGIYRPSTKTLGLSADGTLIFKISNVSAPATSSIETGNFLVSGSVGIGTTNPTSKLTIVDNTNGGTINLVGRTSDDTAAINFRATGDASTYAYVSPDTNEFRLYHNDGFMSFYPGGTEKVRITSGGNVGIGTTSPTAKLHINASGSSINLLRGVTYNDSNASFNNAVLEYYDTSTSAASTVTKANYSAYFNKRGTAAITGYTIGNFNAWTQIDSGSVNAIWDYTSRIEVKNQATASSLYHYVADSGYVIAQGGVLGMATDRIGLYVRTQNQSSLTLTNQYGVYIEDLGQSTNNYGIYSNLSSGVNKYNIYAVGTANNYFAGNVGVGTTSPSALLDVSYGDYQNAGSIRIGADLGTNTSRTNNSRKYGAITSYPFNNASASVQVFGLDAINVTTTGLTIGGGSDTFASPTRIQFYTTSSTTAPGAERMRIDSSGNIGIGTTSPSYQLDVYKTSNDAVIRSRTTGAGAYVYLDSATDGWYGINMLSGSTSRWFVGSYGTTAFTITRGIGSSEYVRVTTDGNVGIGSSNPSSKFEVLTSTVSLANQPNIIGNFRGDTDGRSLIRVDNTSTSAGAAALQSGISFVAYSNVSNQPSTNKHEAQIILGSTGATSVTGGQTGTLQIIAPQDIAFNVSASNVIMTGSSYTTFGTNAMYITRTGNVGIGTTSPSAKLQVGGNISGSSFTSSISNAVGFFGTSSWALNALTASSVLTASSLVTTNNYTINNLTASGAIRAAQIAEKIVTFTPLTGSITGAPAWYRIISGSGIADYGRVRMSTTFDNSRSDIEFMYGVRNYDTDGAGAFINITRASTYNSVFNAVRVIETGNLAEPYAIDVLIGNYVGLGSPSAITCLYESQFIGAVLDVPTFVSASATGSNVVKTVYTTYTSGYPRIGPVYSDGLAVANSQGQLSVGYRGNYAYNVPSGLNYALLVSGSVGIGTDNPSAKLHVIDSTSEQLRIQSSGTPTRVRFVNNAGTTYYSYIGSETLGVNNVGLILQTGNGSATTRMVVDVNGSVGIGTTSPSYKLDVSGSIRADEGEIIATGNNAAFRIYRTTGINYLDWASGQNLYLGTVTSAGGAGRSTKMVVTNTGQVGIGTTSIPYTFDIYNATAADALMSLRSSGSANARIYIDAANGDLLGSDYCYLGQDSGSLNFVINTGGNAGNIHLQPKGGTNNGVLFVSGSTRFGIVSSQTHQFTGSVSISGSIGVGTSNPTGFINGDPVYFSPSSSGTFLSLYSTNSDSNINLVSSASADGTSIGGLYFTRARGQSDAHYQIAAIKAKQSGTSDTLAGGKLHFYTKVNGSGTPETLPQMVIANDGNVGIGVTAPLGRLHITGSATNNETLLYLSKGTGSFSQNYINAVNQAGQINYRVTSDINGHLGHDLYYNGTAKVSHNTYWSSWINNDNFSQGSLGIGTNSQTHGYGLFINNLAYSSGSLKVETSTATANRYVVMGDGVASTNVFTARLDDNSLSYIKLQNLDSTASTNHGTGIRTEFSDNTGSAILDAGGIYFLKEQQWTNNTTSRDSALTFHTALDNSVSEKVRITSGGNVGIGTTIPSVKFHNVGSSILANNTSIDPDTYQNTVVAGAIADGSGWGLSSAIGGNAGTGHTWGIGSNGTNFYMGYGNGSSNNSLQTFLEVSGSRNLLLVPSSGNVGIGTSNPINKLQINGNISGSSFTSSISNAVGFLGTSSWAQTANALNASNTYTVAGLTSAYVDVNGSGTIPTTGIYRPSTKTLGLSADGTLIFKISNVSAPATSSIETGNFIVGSGNVGIGTNNAGYTLQIGQSTAADSTNYRLAILKNGTLGSPGSYQSNAFAIYDYATDGPASVDTTGIAYISAPRIATSDANADNASLLTVVNDTGHVLRASGKQNVYIGYTTATTSTQTNSLLVSGNVGIGTSSPSYKLDVAGGDVNFTSSAILRFGTVAVLNESSNANDIYANIRVIRNSSTVNTDGMFIGYNSTGTTGAHIRFYANGTNERMRIDASSGNVGIGTDSPGARLEISGSSNSALLNIKSPISGAILYVSGSGAIGVGTQAVGTYRLQVSGSFAATTKSFVIDHPTKQGKKLIYGSLESPYHGIRLTGRDTLKDGKCKVELPEYMYKLILHDSINIQLTGIKCNKTLYVDDINIPENYFTIAYDKAIFESYKDYDFFWDFTAIRSDVPELETEL